jgi:malate dehydrogenase (oxaloacetate-decarboxylating)
MTINGKHETFSDRAPTAHELLTNPLLNKGTAFTEKERDLFGLHGLLPPSIGNLEDQIERRLAVLRDFETDIERYAFLRDLQDTNETLFFALVSRNIEEFLPIVYTPVVGQGCEMFSRLYRKPRGLFLSYPNRHRIREILASERFDGVRAIVVTDGDRILGLGDQGAGGMGIPIGKLALYTACGGLHPASTMPIVLDVGTDNAERLADPLYVGWRHARVRGAEYDEFVEEFVSAVMDRWPDVLLQWEDFAKANATPLLERYRDRLCTFNDDVQGTAAVATGTLLSAINVTGTPLAEQRIVIFGAGSAGCGIASLLHQAIVGEGVSPEEAARKFFLVDREGLLVHGMGGIEKFQEPFLQDKEATAAWTLADRPTVTLLDVVTNARPTVLIGVSGQPSAFSEEIVKAMCAAAERPVIFPLSNPTSRAEATPKDVSDWSEGKAVVGTGSPFAPIVRDGVTRKVDQTNNSYIFPGVGLGAISVNATRVSDKMMMAAAMALASMSPARSDPNANLLPPVTELRAVSRAVAIAVASQAIEDGFAPGVNVADVGRLVDAHVWSPEYSDLSVGPEALA